MIKRFAWFLRELLAALLWLGIVVKLCVFDFDNYFLTKYFPSFASIIHYKLFIILAVIALASLFAGRKGAVRFVVYVLLYPLVVLFWRIPKLVFRNWPIFVAFAPAIQSLILGFRVNFILATMSLLCALGISLSSNSTLIIISMVVLSLYLLRHYYYGFKRTFSTSSVFADLAGLIADVQGKFSDSLFAEQLRQTADLDPTSEEYYKKNKASLDTLYILNSVLLYAAEKLKKVVESRKLDVYLMTSLFYTILLTITVFSFEHWGLYKVSPQSYAVADQGGFWAFFAFSLANFMTQSTPLVTPMAPFAHILSGVQLVFALLIAFFLVTIVLSATRERHREDMERVISQLRNSTTMISGRLKADCSLTLDDIEERLIRSSLMIVNTMRRLRGLQEITAPDASPSPAIEPPKQE